MGFISSPVPSLVHSVVTLCLVSELWMQGVVVVNGALEESDSQEHTPFYESHNHINEHDHFHEDGHCDCNSQGPWRPLFKPSQADLPDPESLHHIANSLHDSSSQEQLHDLPNDLHPTIHSGDRQAKKQNHMIHLHLIPHIYVPVVHPVQYSVYENNDHKSEAEQNHDFHTTESSVSSEHFNDHSHSQEQHDDHQQPQQHFYNHDNHLNLQNQDQHDHFYNQDNHLNVPSHQSYGGGGGGDAHQHYDFSEHSHSHESAELNNAHHNAHNTHNGFYYPHHSEEHQYQVHEEGNRDPFYGNYATGSSDNAHVLPINNHLNYFLPAKNKFADRSRYNKRFLDFSSSMLRLGVMRPPALGQKNTWLMNFPDHNAPVFPKSVFDTKTVFDFKPYAVKAPVFDFKQFIKPNVPVIPPILPATKLVQTPVIPMNNFLQTPVMPINKLLPAPVVVYPTEIKKRVDKVKSKN